MSSDAPTLWIRAKDALETAGEILRALAAAKPDTFTGLEEP